MSDSTDSGTTRPAGGAAATTVTPEVSLETVAKVARLARLDVSATDAPRYAGEMAAVLALVEQMSAVDTNGVEPMAHPVGASQRLRADTVTELDQRAAFQAIAPETAEGLYLVPRVVD